MHVLTNYKQLLLYISYDKNNLCKFITSNCFLIPITTAHSMQTYYREFDNILFVYLIRHISLPKSNEKPTMDNIDSYMLKLQSLIINSTSEHQQLIMEVKAIMRQLQNSLANGVTPVAAVKSSDTHLSAPNPTI